VLQAAFAPAYLLHPLPSSLWLPCNKSHPASDCIAVAAGASVTNTMGGPAMAFEMEDKKKEEEELELTFAPEDAKE